MTFTTVSAAVNDSGVSFNDFINLLRVEEAGQLLLPATLSITEIAYQVRFANVRSLNRAFVKHRGLTPGEIRKAAQRQKPTYLKKTVLHPLVRAKWL